jgi:D-tagatose-1,6-bisphosphate aldolase subunit GatZ/KbaZ
LRAIDIFRSILRSNKKGLKTGIYSVCSAHETVIKASMQQARADQSILLIESTSNQVNQEGGYTGMQPRDFADFVAGIASEMSFDPDLILLGGDHLGPNTWQHLPAADAMKKADTLVYEYVKAGFQKIHLDASMFLADDRGDRKKPLADETVAARTAQMCSAAEQAWEDFRKNSPRPLYIIGTEVPVPGGARDNEAVKATRPQDAAKTIAVAKEAFYEHQLHSAWERVCGVVVQPGVEFGGDHVFDYQPAAAVELSREIENHENFVYEVHSTDYQAPEALAQLVADHFCILKVGPWLTFAYREALFALAGIENHLLESNPDRASSLPERLEKVMLENPRYWEKYYAGTDKQMMLKRKFSYLDRCRYYWPYKELSAAQKKLYANLRHTGIPPGSISQYMPNQYLQIRRGSIDSDPETLVLSKIREVLRVYAEACRLQQVIHSLPQSTE